MLGVLVALVLAVPLIVAVLGIEHLTYQIITRKNRHARRVQRPALIPRAPFISLPLPLGNAFSCGIATTLKAILDALPKLQLPLTLWVRSAEARLRGDATLDNRQLPPTLWDQSAEAGLRGEATLDNLQLPQTLGDQSSEARLSEELALETMVDALPNLLAPLDDHQIDPSQDISIQGASANQRHSASLILLNIQAASSIPDPAANATFSTIPAASSVPDPAANATFSTIPAAASVPDPAANATSSAMSAARSVSWRNKGPMVDVTYYLQEMLAKEKKQKRKQR